MDKQTGKLIARIAENLPDMSGDVMQGWIENPTGLQKVLKEALCPTETIPAFKIWKTIQIGTGLKTADDFRKAIKKSGMRISNWADDILGKSAFTASTEEMDLVNVSASELGFKSRVKRVDIYARANKLGLRLCPNEIGPQLRLQYKDQPKGERLVIAMKPIADFDGYLGVFSVKRDNSGLWLSSSIYGNPDGFWSPGSRWVFVLPRK